MKLIELKVSGFRGFNDEQSLDFGGRLVIYAGPNGSGKTAIGEAIEWLLFGKTLKRTKGDEISKREYAGSYRNLHFRGSSRPYVEAKVVDKAGVAHIIRRELSDDESSVLTIDGQAAQDLRHFGVGTIYDRPLILQHTLQDFIFMKPKTRYEVLSAMLGLEGLIDFRNAVETAKNEFPKRLPGGAAEAQARSNAILASFKAEPLLRPVGLAVEQGNPSDGRKHLVQVGLGRVTPGTQEADLLPALRAAQAALERAQLDWGRSSLNPLVKPDAHPALAKLPALEEKRHEFEKSIQEAVRQVAASPEAPADPKRQQFVRLGLELRDISHPEQCPFCLQDTLTPEILAQLHKVIEVIPAARAPLAAAKSGIHELEALLRQQWAGAAELQPRMPSQEESAQIQDISKEAPVPRDAYLASCQAMDEYVILLHQRKKGLDEALRAITAALNEGRAPEGKVPGLATALTNYVDHVRALPAVANAYAAAYAALDPHVRAKLASAEEVRFLGLITRGLEQWKDLGVACHVTDLQETFQELIRQTRRFIELKQKEILGLRDKEIKNWYDLLNPGAPVGYDQIVPGTDSLELRARSFTAVMMAAPNLSASQLNCIGLAVYFACATRSGSPFHFLLIDDPIQSLDDEHTEAFKKQAIERLLKQDFQVILLTHMENFADDVERLYRGYQPILYRLTGYTMSGPSISWKGPEIKKLLEEVRKNKDSVNQGYRMNAVQSLRQFVERFAKDLFVAETGAPVSKKYENESWTRLRDLLRQCKRFDQADEAILEDTHNFTSPYLHTDATIAQKVPSAAQINPHYDAMKRLMDKYAAVLGVK